MNNYIVVVWIKKYLSIFGKFFSIIIPFLIPTFFIFISNILIDFQIWKLILIIFLFISIGYFFIKSMDIFNEYEGRFTSFVNVLENDLLKKAEGINKRPVRISPDFPQTDFGLYQKMITKIKTRGYAEFICQNMGCEIGYKWPLTLSAISPGMHQYFLVLTYGHDPSSKGYFRIYDEELVDKKQINKSKIIPSDSRDFTQTIFNDLFPILGNFSDKISEKMSGQIMLEAANEHYLITSYKLRKKRMRRGNGFYYIRIFL
ncbi:MAG: hypothetical protein BGO78_14340 [Chloroflexi bacterium 44-23]|nr:MAG: hypothetical protein BGO78_14340 [Chloroflexi bacterium 44-23]